VPIQYLFTHHVYYNKKRKTICVICKTSVCLRLQEKLLANLDEDQQIDAGLAGGDEVSQLSLRFFLFSL